MGIGGCDWSLLSQAALKSDLNSRFIRRDNDFPYSVCEETDGIFQTCVWRIPDGQHSLVAYAYTGSDGRGYPLPGLNINLHD